jgi:uncharacterized membrane protein
VYDDKPEHVALTKTDTRFVRVGCQCGIARKRHQLRRRRNLRGVGASAVVMGLQYHLVHNLQAQSQSTAPVCLSVHVELSDTHLSEFCEVSGFGESYPVAQLCVSTLLASKVTLIIDGI